MTAPPSTHRRLRLQVAGAVQGVGMRPFLYRAASELGLQGWLRNDTRGVTLELEGDEGALGRFLDGLRTRPPPRAVIHEIREEWLDPAGLEGLAIRPSDASGDRVAAVLPDLATCPACLADIGHAGDRRAGYAFTNCTDCGPRFSIIRSLPYDRPNTTMAGFALCPSCREEYDDPLDRRFHAQPTACPACGPRLTLLDGAGTAMEPAAGPARDAAVLWAVAAAIRAGGVVAVQGLGGFHLVVDAGSEAAVQRLRARKHRPVKPLAVMVRDLEAARRLCHVPEAAASLLVAPESPIVLLRRRADAPIADGVAPGNPYVGLLLPYTPLHHLLLAEVGRPVVATSGNLSDEPICIDPGEAVSRLGGIADLYLVHDRPIERAVDDSVAQLVDGAPRLLRRSRGYAPLPVRLPREVPPILATGAHLKNTVALARGRDVFLSQHIGDLETPEARAAFRRVIDDFLRLYDVAPTVIAHDLHPDYASSAWAAAATATSSAAEPAGDEGAPGSLAGARRVPVQHHHAHLASCLAEHGVEGPALGVVWDGTGLGPDGTIWGGEFLLGDAGGYTRVAHLRPFRLPGGDAAVKEPRRMALSLLHEAFGPAGSARLLRTAAGDTFDPGELRILARLLDTGFRAPWTTSAGRLFDGAAALLGLRQKAGFEGEAAMALEYAVDPAERGAYAFEIGTGGGAEAGASADAEADTEADAEADAAWTGAAQAGAAPLVVDWVPAVAAMLDDVARGEDAAVAAARLHNGMVAAIGAVAERVGVERVALTGGCFQNRVLAEGAADALRRAGHEPLLHRRVPANDGGIALGQVAVAAAVVAGTRGR